MNLMQNSVILLNVVFLKIRQIKAPRDFSSSLLENFRHFDPGSRQVEVSAEFSFPTLPFLFDT